MSSASSCDVLVIGAGPVGLMTALLLAKQNVKVTVVESNSNLVDSPRAIVYLPQVIGTLEAAGILDEVAEKGHVVHSPPCWRTTSDMKLQAQFDFSVLRASDLPIPKHRMAILMGQQILGRVLLEKLKALDVPILFDHNITDITQDASSVTVKALRKDTPDDANVSLSGAFLIACDGGRSFVRRHLGITLEGFTHDLAFMSINVNYPDVESYNLNDANFLVDPCPSASNPGDSDMGVLIRTGEAGVWRCAYGDDAALSEDELRGRIPARLKRILPGHPDEHQYTLLLAQPYKVHQRSASTFVKGRILLAGDAAHLNNPIGGMGLCTGLLDAHAASVALTAALGGKGADFKTPLEKYNVNRRKAFNEATNPMSIENLRRLREQSDEVDKMRDEFFAKMRRDKEFQREYLLEMNGMAFGVPGFESLAPERRESKRFSIRDMTSIFRRGSKS